MKSIEKVFLLLMAVFMMVPVVNAAVIGTDSFDYPDGSIDGQSGGTGWDIGGFSDWNIDFGSEAISGGVITTDNSGVIREFGGDEYAAAVKATGKVYFGMTMTVMADSYDWAGVSSFDFGTERIFFGCPGSQPDPGPSGMGYYGIDIPYDSGYALTDISVVRDQAARIVGCIDFDGEQLLLWVNPDAGDYDNGGGDNSADVALSYTYTNWSSAVRLASGSAVGWDDLVVATDFASTVSEPATVQNNPVMDGADPDILLVGNTVWMYTTSGGRRYFYAYSSNDLVHWHTHGPILNIDNVSWMPDGKWAWAPGVHQKNGVYFLYYSAGPKPSYIGVATSNSPGGPFIDSGAPLLADNGDPTFEAIDAMVFTDPQTGKTYLYAGGSAGSRLRVFELNSDLVSIAQEISVDNPYRFTEGSFMHYHDGLYYMSYSHGTWNTDSYSMHYSIASSPVGPWTYQGQLLYSDYRHKGPGHHSFLYNAAMDEWYIFYHRWNNRAGSGPYSGSRSIAIENMYYNANGTINPFALTDSGVGPVWLGNALRADFDESGTVGIEDILYLSSVWLTNDEEGDLSPIGGDGIVNIFDLAGLSSQWLKQPQSH